MSQDHVKSLFIPGESAFESIEIGTIPDIGLINFDEVVMVLKIAEPIDPSNFNLLTEFAIV